MTRAPTKTATLTLRIDPHVKDLLTAAALADRRSLSNMLEVIVLGHCKLQSVAVGKSDKSKPVAKKKRDPA